MGTRRVGVVTDLSKPAVMEEKTVLISLLSVQLALELKKAATADTKQFICPLGVAASSTFGRPAYATRCFLHLDRTPKHEKAQIWVAIVGLDRDRHNTLLDLFDAGQIEALKELLESPMHITYTKPLVGN